MKPRRNEETNLSGEGMGKGGKRKEEPAASVGLILKPILIAEAKEGIRELGDEMKFVGWYVKIALGSAMVGAAMELFMIHTGFYDKVTVLESEKRAWESSPEGQAVKEALNPWRKHNEEAQKKT
ncbi:hypothetical protein FCM35_KLT04116 [Carex littledalei]|uniref:Uncharacterized protein n=1 Tax=Carex littledalei TaxID=544730 RepID=A0A833VAC3_9POAL|nr:hypothetical protein FCM35_KLT04116 [Carex littledalei]